MSKRLYIKTYGCQMNVYDSERISDTMQTVGYGEADDMADADLIVAGAPLAKYVKEKYDKG